MFPPLQARHPPRVDESIRTRIRSVRAGQEGQAFLHRAVLQQRRLGLQRIPQRRSLREEIWDVVGGLARSRGHRVDGAGEEVVGVLVGGYEGGLVGVGELVDPAVEVGC